MHTAASSSMWTKLRQLHIIIFLTTLLAGASGFALAQGQSSTPSGTGQTGSAASTSAGSSAAAAPSSGKSALSRADQNRLKALAQAQVNEIAGARLALDRSKNESVRKFAQTMMEDHTKALSNLTAMAQANNVPVPTDPDNTHKTMAARLQKLPADAFDKAYIKEAGVIDHTKVHSMLLKDASGAANADLKAMANAMVPVVAGHLDSANSLQTALATGTSAGTTTASTAAATPATGAAAGAGKTPAAGGTGK